MGSECYCVWEGRWSSKVEEIGEGVGRHAERVHCRKREGGRRIDECEEREKRGWGEWRMIGKGSSKSKAMVKI